MKEEEMFEQSDNVGAGGIADDLPVRRADLGAVEAVEAAVFHGGAAITCRYLTAIESAIRGELYRETEILQCAYVRGDEALRRSKEEGEEKGEE